MAQSANFQFKPGDIIRRLHGQHLWVITEVGTDSNGEQWLRKVRLGRPTDSASRLISYAPGWVLEARPSKLLCEKSRRGA